MSLVLFAFKYCVKSISFSLNGLCLWSVNSTSPITWSSFGEVLNYYFQSQLETKLTFLYDQLKLVADLLSASGSPHALPETFRRRLAAEVSKACLMLNESNQQLLKLSVLVPAMPLVNTILLNLYFNLINVLNIVGTGWVLQWSYDGIQDSPCVVSRSSGILLKSILIQYRIYSWIGRPRR